jgi:hypothetical protein
MKKKAAGSEERPERQGQSAELTNVLPKKQTQVGGEAQVSKWAVKLKCALIYV